MLKQTKTLMETMDEIPEEDPASPGKSPSSPLKLRRALTILDKNAEEVLKTDEENK